MALLDLLVALEPAPDLPSPSAAVAGLLAATPLLTAVLSVLALLMAALLAGLLSTGLALAGLAATLAGLLGPLGAELSLALLPVGTLPSLLLPTLLGLGAALLASADSLATALPSTPAIPGALLVVTLLPTALSPAALLVPSSLDLTTLLDAAVARLPVLLAPLLEVFGSLLPDLLAHWLLVSPVPVSLAGPHFASSAGLRSLAVGLFGLVLLRIGVLVWVLTHSESRTGDTRCRCVVWLLDKAAVSFCGWAGCVTVKTSPLSGRALGEEPHQVSATRVRST